MAFTPMSDGTAEAKKFPAPRRKTRAVRVGKLAIGGGAPVSVQSMAKCPTTDVDAVVEQIRRVVAAGCDIFRVAVPDQAAAEAIGAIVQASPIPIVADVHFDWRLAVAAVERGAHKVRLNPGNIGGRENVARVVEACLCHGAAMRLGVNAGSLERDLLDKYGGPKAEALAESALRCAALIDELGMPSAVISIKAHDVARTVVANRIFAAESDLPLHLGITEAGGGEEGIVRSAVGIGILLAEGIGDTIRVSLTAPPEQEVRAGRLILRSLGLQPGPVVVSCPTCARVQIPVAELAAEVRAAVEDVTKPVVIAVMGCEVNGPGEAREADLGIAGGRQRAVIFRAGKVIRTVPKAEAVAALCEELDRLLSERGDS